MVQLQRYLLSVADAKISAATLLCRSQTGPDTPVCEWQGWVSMRSSLALFRVRLWDREGKGNQNLWEPSRCIQGIHLLLGIYPTC